MKIRIYFLKELQKLCKYILKFCFEGFLPQKKGRQTRIEQLAAEPRTTVIYESPYRLVKTLQQFAAVCGEDRQVSVCREISKIHEESVRGTLADVISHFTETPPKGEIVIVLAGCHEMKEEKDGKQKDKPHKKKAKFRNEGQDADCAE